MVNQEDKSVMCPNYKEGDGVVGGIDLLWGGENYSFFFSALSLFKRNELAFLSQECTQHYSLLARHSGHNLTRNKDSAGPLHRLRGQTLK